MDRSRIARAYDAEGREGLPPKMVVALRHPRGQATVATRGPDTSSGPKPPIICLSLARSTLCASKQTQPIRPLFRAFVNRLDVPTQLRGGLARSVVAVRSSSSSQPRTLLRRAAADHEDGGGGMAGLIGGGRGRQSRDFLGLATRRSGMLLEGRGAYRDPPRTCGSGSPTRCLAVRFAFRISRYHGVLFRFATM